MHNDLVEERFRLNMGRINDLAKLIFSDINPLRAAKPFQSEGARADGCILTLSLPWEAKRFLTGRK